MSTGIEWVATHHPDGRVTRGDTWNPVTGCTAVSPGCDHCYAEHLHTQRHLANLRYADNSPGRLAMMRAAGDRAIPQPACYDVPFTVVTEHPDRLLQPLKWQTPRKIFACSMADLFHAQVTRQFQVKVWAVSACSVHTVKILTKRPNLAARFTRQSEEAVYGAINQLHDEGAFANMPATGDRPAWDVPLFWPPPNIWLGTSVEGQAQKWRIAELRKADAAIRFISFEPLLEHLGTLDLAGISWAIIGGESGPGARPFDLEWARDIIRQCDAQGVAVFVKQLGAHPVTGWATRVSLRQPEGRNMAEWPADLQRREYPK